MYVTNDSHMSNDLNITNLDDQAIMYVIDNLIVSQKKLAMPH